MADNRLILPKTWVDYLVNLPETGMGYQLVKVILKNGIVLKNHKVLNASVLVLEENENILAEDIERILPDHR